ncbi:MAG: hypothetical protein MZV63_01745 [Marinilabiliales bacterium]|nr:hypothetical protein [Marinilabiliales bacterium]
MRSSKLYRSDQDSYLLYPFRVLPKFTEKNNILEGKVFSSKLLAKLLDDGNNAVINQR